MNVKLIIPLSMAVISCLAQRPPYAGRRPIGYPEIEAAPTSGTNDLLANKFGTEDDNSTSTERLPIEALGDRDLVNRLLKLPIDKQPFWLLNWKALEAQRNKPQTYPSKPNDFLDTTSNQAANRFGQTKPNTNRPPQNNQNVILSSQSGPSNGNVVNQNGISSQSTQGNQNFELSSQGLENIGNEQLQNQNGIDSHQGNLNFASSTVNHGVERFAIQNTQQKQNKNIFSNRRPSGANALPNVGNGFTSQNGQRVESSAFANNNQASSMAGGFINQNNRVRPSNIGQASNHNNQQHGDLNDFISSAPSTNKPTTSETYKLFSEVLNNKPLG